jgi:hypothetical protein
VTCKPGHRLSQQRWFGMIVCYLREGEPFGSSPPAEQRPELLPRLAQGQLQVVI